MRARLARPFATVLVSLFATLLLSAPGQALAADCSTLPARAQAYASSVDAYNAEVIPFNASQSTDLVTYQRLLNTYIDLDIQQRALLAEAATCNYTGTIKSPTSPSAENPVAPFPTPKPFPASSGVVGDVNVQGIRLVTYNDGGRAAYYPLENGRAVGISANVTKGMLDKGTSTVSQGSNAVNPLGLKSPFEIRGHLQAQILGGSGSDIRNISALTRSANGQMATVEREVYSKLSACTEPNAVVQYTVQLQYAVAAPAPPLRIYMTASGPCGISIARLINNIA